MPNFLFYFLLLCCGTGYLVFKNWTSKEASSSRPVDFKKFQKNYLFVYFCVMAGDWLQGPYVYALYSSYGFDQHDIAVLFVAGFGSSMIFGTFIGSLADSLGRKKFCLLYILTYVASCLTKHVNSYSVLMLGRLLGGVATSLLFSVFDAWMINEHNARSFDAAWIGETFATAIFGNSCVAIAAGLVANFASEIAPLKTLGGEDFATSNDGHVFKGGFCAPFDVAILVLSLGGAYIQNNWGENFGHSSGGNAEADDVFKMLKKGFDSIVYNPSIILCGTISSLFEGSMFTFVFMWTPALQPSAGEDETLPFGLIFAAFMVACMAGSSLFTVLSKSMSIEEISKYTFVVAALSLFVPVVTTSYNLIFVGFLVFEGCVGMYFPAMGTLKSKIVPESQRSTIYNIFRIPLNIIVLGVLLTKMEMSTAFFCCSAMLAMAAACQFKLVTVLKFKGDDVGRGVGGGGDEESLLH
ncbi:hypothetical protein TrLO_g7880 [Triparma laevis f. longispina]|uniref:Molybdate-anion transporter n=1 Tax=Triparma laevis f. longispina TaxID=1714387 RepID=A0A9W7A398_9STRA|nr:hypothetical protein TrLO_g7880 [Triparma laevis f. longispina]